MTVVLNTLLQITVYSVVLFMVICLFQRLLRRRISAALNCAVWALLLLRLIVPVTIESGWHLFTMPQQSVQTVQTQNVPVSDTVETPAISSAVQPISDKDMVSSQSQFEAESVADKYVKSVPAKPLDWQTIIMVVWASGAFGFLAYMAIQWLRLSRRIKCGGMHTPDFVRDMANAEKRALRIRRNIRVSVQDWLVSPALSASLRPSLMLPVSMLQDDEALNFGIRHELMHYKRKDHLLSLLLLALRCVYWFNPVVWLAFRRIQTDVETACDEAVTARMATQERTRYIHVMIDMGRDSKPLYTLGMSAGNGRKALEKRVRGIFMTKRTGLSVRMASTLLALLLFVACFTTACQPVPEEPVVLNTDEAVPKAAAVETPPAPAKSDEAPETLAMDPFTVGEKLTVSVNAAVDIPDAESYPVYEFVPAAFTQAQADAMINYFYKDQTLYEKEYGWSKAALEQKLAEQQKMYQEILDGATNAAGNPKYEMSAEDVQRTIEETKKLILIAPEINDGKISDGQLKKTSYGGIHRTTLSITNSPGQKDSHYLLMNSVVEKSQSNLFLLGGVRFNADNSMPQGTQAKGLQTTPEQAKTIVKEMLDACGFEFMEPANVYSGDESEDGKSADTGGYIVVCLRRAGDFYVTNHATGITADISNLSQEDMQAAYSKLWVPEQLTVCVDDTGITAIEWRGYGSIATTVTDNASLLPFDQLGASIKNGFTSYYAWNEETMGKEELQRDISVSRIALSMARVQVTGHPEDWALVPVFEIYGTVTTWHGGEASAQSFESLGNGFLTGSLLTVNAVDGSIVYGQNVSDLPYSGTM